MPNAIEVTNLSKKFTYYPSQRDRFFDMATGGRVKRGTDFMALDGISFEVPQGTTFGIIGQNGSGKSTLLSILAGVLQQTAGTFKVNGKIAAILELGSGFHHEFTGCENVYMYGAILSLSREEIDRRFDEIVDFSELHEFIDRPLYTYSSGMVVRLAFAVAVNVDADILLVDEALAVGDALFQARCFRKIKEMQKEGRTILYVGHDIDILRNLCTEAILIDGGKIKKVADVNQVSNAYVAQIKERESEYRKNELQRVEKNSNPDAHNFWHDNRSHGDVRFGNKDVEIIRTEILDSNYAHIDSFHSSDHGIVRITLRANKEIHEGLNVGYILRNKFIEIYGINTYWLNTEIGPRAKETFFMIEFTQCLNLGKGTYTISPIVAQRHSLYSETILDWYNDAIAFTMQNNNDFLGPLNLKSAAIVRDVHSDEVLSNKT